MRKNMGIADKIIRIIIAAIVGIIYYTGTVSGTLGLIFLLFAVFFVITSLLNVCPFYIPFGISSAPSKKSKEALN